MSKPAPQRDRQAQGDEDPAALAAAADLVYVSDETPGISRIRRGRGYSFYRPDGELVTDQAERERLKTLAVPPAWEAVWICALPNGHLQATGRDARQRKQYIYHQRWVTLRQKVNFERMVAFGEALPAIRAGVDRDLQRRGLPRERVLALVVEVLENTLIRIGNPRSARENRTFGLTTLRNRHIELRGDRIHFAFRGKSGIEREIDVRDARCARALRRCQQLPGQRLFQYLDEDGARREVDSRDVNAYLKELAEGDFTAKDFRTWGGTLQALEFLLAQSPADDQQARHRQSVAALRHAAEHLGNTLAVCRRHYVHPGLIEAWEAGRLGDLVRPAMDAAARAYLEESERRLLGLLRRVR
ncbi:MAG: DNA topoisomerase IB [Pseudomonadota bacterium]|nr:DNA topoisomerase IB [Pseudomonadota bacterium]